ncbi:MAG: 2-amino-4-hydroxy-6-hydroxymethyldihydropteridine diphosphokinase [Chloroflexota bacterium]
MRRHGPTVGDSGRPPPRRRLRAYLGLGSNLGDREQTLLAVLGALAELPDTALRGVSDLYWSSPVGPAEQPPYLNAAVALDVAISGDPAAACLALLRACKSIEAQLGRRPRARWGPREVDLDILVFGRHRIRLGVPPEDGRGALGRGERTAEDAASPTSWLIVPHPEAQRRRFVVAPLADLAPGLVPPGWGETVASVAKRLAASEPRSVVKIGRWSGTGWVPLAEPAGGRRPPDRPTVR